MSRTSDDIGDRMKPDQHPTLDGRPVMIGDRLAATLPDDEAHEFFDENDDPIPQPFIVGSIQWDSMMVTVDGSYTVRDAPDAVGPAGWTVRPVDGPNDNFEWPVTQCERADLDADGKPYFFRGTLDGADFAPEDGVQPFIRVGAPELGEQRAAGEVVVLDADTYGEILSYVWASLDAMLDEGIGDRGGPLSPLVLAQAAEHVGADLCAKWNLSLIDDVTHGAKCDCWSARSWRGEKPAEPEPDPIAAKIVEAEEARMAQERAEGRRKPWEEVDPDDHPEGAGWSFQYRPVIDGSEHPADIEGRMGRWRPYGDAILVPVLRFPAVHGWTVEPMPTTTEED